jgi:DNA-binding MarR family transcriptional regulator
MATILEELIVRIRPRSRLQIAGELLTGLNGLQRSWEARWRQICEECDVHVSQAQALLFLLEQGAEPMSVLAKGLCIAPSTATRLVEQMEKESWVARAGDPEDRRRVLIHLLPRGEERAWTLQSHARHELWDFAGVLPDAESTLKALNDLGLALARND